MTLTVPFDTNERFPLLRRLVCTVWPCRVAPWARTTASMSIAMVLSTKNIHKKVAVYGDTMAINTLEHGIQLYQRMQYDESVSNHTDSASNGTSIVGSRQVDPPSSPTKVTHQLVQ